MLVFVVGRAGGLESCLTMKFLIKDQNFDLIQRSISSAAREESTIVVVPAGFNCFRVYIQRLKLEGL